PSKPGAGESGLRRRSVMTGLPAAPTVRTHPALVSAVLGVAVIRPASVTALHPGVAGHEEEGQDQECDKRERTHHRHRPAQSSLTLRSAASRTSPLKRPVADGLMKPAAMPLAPVLKVRAVLPRMVTVRSSMSAPAIAPNQTPVPVDRRRKRVTSTSMPF